MKYLLVIMLCFLGFNAFADNRYYIPETDSLFIVSNDFKTMTVYVKGHNEGSAWGSGATSNHKTYAGKPYTSVSFKSDKCDIVMSYYAWANNTRFSYICGKSVKAEAIDIPDINSQHNNF
ncbi:hypothetical protein REXELLA_33 [Erwinia phage vB_EamP_Rexella]|uniref:Uncharacterized protein n=1 Tax=Erwinia phage vB_EamP_Rexella TaxID=1852642 RepID=A0A191ZCZ8_9CAUD|nr:hypothetical protein REXELLA_33 [Erwinia phage vB_EamP_Rexella]